MKPTPRLVRSSETGVTLAETLVVLAVIAVAGAAAVFGLLPRTAGSVAVEAARLAGLVSLAADKAMTGQERVALVWTAQDYVFQRWSGAEGAWLPVSTGPLAGARILPEGITLRRTDGGRGPIVLQPGGLSPSASIELSGDGDARQIDFDGLAARVVIGSGT